MKLLPFDNKSEIAVVVDLPEGASLEDTERTLFAAADIARGLPEVDVGAGLCRHRRRRSISTASCGTIICASAPELGELQVNLAARGRAQPRQPRHRAGSARSAEGRSPLPAGTSIKVVEVPPGPPVLATLLAEIYGPDAATRRAVTGEAQEDLRRRAVHRRYRRFDRPAAAAAAAVDRPGPAGILRRRAARRLRHHRRRCSAACTVGYSHRGEGRNPIEIAVRLPKRDLAWTRGAGLDAGAGQHAAGRQDRRRTGRSRAAPTRRARRRSSAATAASPTW